MKSNILAATTIVLLLTINGAYAGIQGSMHDFSHRNWNSTGELCVVCHAPHQAESFNNIPLWNHQTTQAVFTPYSSSTMNATVGQPDGISLACLSCHDGTVAVDSFGGQTGTEFLGSYIGNDLSNDHPISFTYDTALATTAGNLHDPATTTSGLGGTIQRDLLRENKVQCTSCHDVHNTYNLQRLLVKSNAGSALCLTCHNT